MTTDLLFTNRLARAAVFACQAHSGQTRDDNTTPYAVHLFRVVEHLRSIADERDAEVLCAAYLHDTLEDTLNTFDTLAALFGADVATLVAELTNDNRLPKAQRRSAMIEHMPFISPRAKRIKLADRLDNVTDVLRSAATTPNDAGILRKSKRYFVETERILKACENACPPLELALHRAYEDLAKCVG